MARKAGDDALLHMGDGSYRPVLISDYVVSERDGERYEVRSAENDYRSGALVPAECVVDAPQP